MSHASPEVQPVADPVSVDGTYPAWGAPVASPAPAGPVAIGLQPLPLVAGLVAAVVGTLLWALAVRVTNDEIGFAAVGVAAIAVFAAIRLLRRTS